MALNSMKIPQFTALQVMQDAPVIPVKGGTTVIAFITDPDGYKVELIQRDFS